MRSVTRRLILAAAGVALFATAALLGVYRASRRVPEFYRKALAAPPTLQREGGQRFERHALALHNQFHHAGHWEVRFDQDDINGWLAADLPAKFPRALPPGVSEPRIAIDRGAVRLAVHYQRSGVDTVVSLSGQAYLTDQPNEVAIHVEQARAGLLPVPLGKFVQEITERAARANVPLRWTEAHGTPVALVRVPLALDDVQRRQFVLERLHFGDGELVVAGRTEEPAPDSDDRAAPSTAVQPGDSEIRQR
jgi:hypothetical protein